MNSDRILLVRRTRPPVQAPEFSAEWNVLDIFPSGIFGTSCPIWTIRIHVGRTLTTLMRLSDRLRKAQRSHLRFAHLEWEPAPHAQSVVFCRSRADPWNAACLVHPHARSNRPLKIAPPLFAYCLPTDVRSQSLASPGSEGRYLILPCLLLGIRPGRDAPASLCALQRDCKSG